MLNDYQDDLGEIFPPGFGGDVSTASAMGAIGTYTSLLPGVWLGAKLVDVRKDPRLWVLATSFATAAIGVGLGRLLYTKHRTAALGLMGGAVGSALSVLWRLPFVTDEQLQTAAAGGGVKGLSLSELIEGESEGLYPGNYAFP